MTARLLKTIASARSAAPAGTGAFAVALGQGTAWWLSANSCLALMAVAALLIASGHSALRWIFAGLLAGLCSCYAQLGHESPPFEAGSLGSPHLVRLLDSGRRGQPGRVTFFARDLLRASQPLLHISAVELPWRNAASLNSGDVIWVSGDTTEIPRGPDPWSWDSFLWRRGVRAQVKARYVSMPVERLDAPMLLSARDWVRQETVRLLGERQGGWLFLSMALGYRDVLSNTLESALSDLGLSHLLVVSGYQVTMVFSVVSVPLGLLAGLLQASKWARHGVPAAALMLTGCYVAFIGGEPSAVRAMVAAIFVCAESLHESARRFSQRWGIALLAVQLVWPWAALEIGVQLTFAALAGIGAGRCLGRGGAVRTFLWIQLSVWVLTGAIVVAWSGKVAWLGLLVNVALAPLWSAWNCIVGLGSFLFAALGVPGAASVLCAVAVGNEFLALVATLARESLGEGSVLEGASRWAVFLAYTLAGAVLLRVAARRSRSVTLRALAR